MVSLRRGNAHPMPTDQKCPKCRGTDMKRWELPNWMLLHWVINPGLAFNELVLGQRIPKVTLICQSCRLPLVERQYVPCPSCGAIHDGRLWAGKRGFGNWLGLVCPACGKRIPCLRNAFAFVLVCVSAPTWYLPYRLYFRDRPVSRPVQTPSASLPTLKKVAWSKMALLYGLLMWLITSLVPATFIYAKTGSLPVMMLVVGGGLWLLGGVAFGFFMYLFLSRKPRSRNVG